MSRLIAESKPREWTLDETDYLLELIETHGENWSVIQEAMCSKIYNREQSKDY